MMNQMTATELLELVNDHFDEIYAVWGEMVNEGKNDTTLVIAAEEWLRRKKVHLSSDDRPRCDHGVVFPMSNCAECLRVKVGVLQQQLDATEAQRVELDDACESFTKIEVKYCEMIETLRQRLGMFRCAMQAILAAPWHLFGAKKRIAKVALDIDAEQAKECCDE